MSLIQIILLCVCASFTFSYSPESTPNVQIGFDYCATGPVAWCKNFTSAIQCNAVKHCLQAVWLTHELPASIFGSCGSCEREIQRIRREVGSNKIGIIVKQLLENVCSSNFVINQQSEEYLHRCVGTYSNDLLDLLNSNIDSVIICRILGICSNVKPSILLSEGNVVIRFENILLNIPSNQIDLTNSEKLFGAEKCTWGPSYWCKNITTSKACKLTSHCIRYIWSQKHFIEDNDSVCKICKDMVQQARDQLQSNETQDELRKVFEGSCKLISIQEVEKECLKLADEFVPELTEMLVSEMYPTAVCSVAGLCNNNHIDILLKIKLTSSVTADNSIPFYDYASSPLDDIQLARSSATEPVKTVECQFCKIIIKMIQKEVDKPEYEHDIEKVLKKVCSLVPRTDKEKCDDFIEEYADVLIKMLVDHTDPGTICQMLELCPDFFIVWDYKLCPLCQYLLHFIQEELEKPEEQEEIEEAAKKVCRYFPASQENECETFIDNYTSLILALLSEEIDPSLVCPALKVCPSLLSPLDRCVHCQFLLENMIVNLKNDLSPQNIMNQFTMFVPHKNNNLTLTAVDLKFNHREDIIDMMSAKFNVQETCLILHFCDPTTLSSTVDVVSDLRRNE